MAGQYWRPDWFAIWVFNPAVRAIGGTTLEVAGRRTGELQRVPVNLLEHDGARYVVALRGNTEWARNLRAAGRCTVRKGLRRTGYVSVELPVAERAPIIEAYNAKWGGQSKRFFKRLPDIDAHPVFRLDPES